MSDVNAQLRGKIVKVGVGTSLISPTHEVSFRKVV